MARMRSPSYPAISLLEAIELVRKIHGQNRTNAIDREAAAKDMGYSGITGRSLTMLASLLQYGLLERAGKGGVRVTRAAVDILHGLTDEIKKNALLAAGTAPPLYQELMDRFPDGAPSQNALRSYLIQRDFADAAINPAVSSFLETYQALQDANVFDTHGLPVLETSESPGDATSEVPTTIPPSPLPQGMTTQFAAAAATATNIASSLAVPALNKINMNVKGGRVHLEAVLNRKGIEALERKLASLKNLLDDDDEEDGPPSLPDNIKEMLG